MAVGKDLEPSAVVRILQRPLRDKALTSAYPLKGLFCFVFLMWTPLKALLNLLQYCLCFMFWLFAQEACGILAPPPGMELVPPALEGEVLITGHQGSPFTHL